jgi:hypothetical protein
MLQRVSHSINIAVAMFKGSDADALEGNILHIAGTNATAFALPLSLYHEEVSGSTSSITFKVRAGPSTGTCYLNGDATTSSSIVVANTYLSITEIRQ